MIEKTRVKAGEIVRHFDGRMWIDAEHHKAAIERAYENGRAIGVAIGRDASVSACQRLRSSDGEGQHVEWYAGIDGCIEVMRGKDRA